MEFGKFSLKDIEKIKEYIFKEDEYCCENTFANLMLWQETYNNRFALEDGHFYIRWSDETATLYNIPFGKDLKTEIEALKKHSGGNLPKLWVAEGGRFQRFKALYGEDYVIMPQRDSFDYIYNREDLATLHGGKYHAKRNHISAFSKKFDWKYENITPENAQAVKECAEKWYKENADRFDDTMQTEKHGLYMLLDNMEALGVLGGMITVEGKAVAFTLGTPINTTVFDIHIEKALADYSLAYTVINQQFAENVLGNYKYINREDDLGLEGLRKAKLSYKPEILLKKYICLPKTDPKFQKCREIYNNAFTTDKEFDDILFNNYFHYCRFLEVENEVVSMLFAFPFTLKEGEKEVNGHYIYGVATDENKRGRGYMKKLLASLESDTYVLKPQSESLFDFYAKSGFKRANCRLDNTQKTIELSEELKPLYDLCEREVKDYDFMYKSDEEIDFEGASFPDTMH